MDRKARERKRSDYTEPKNRLRATEDHAGTRPFNTENANRNDTDRNNNEYVLKDAN